MSGTVEKKARGQRHFVRRIAEIVDLDLGRVVGSQVEWNTGEKRLQWYGKRARHYALRPCASVQDWPDLGGQGG